MKNKLLILSIITLLVLPIILAETEIYPINQDIDLKFTCTLNNQIPDASTEFNITISYPNGSTFINNQQATSLGNGAFNYTTMFTELGLYKSQMFCYNGTYSYSNEGYYEITPTGKIVSDTGQISIGILYFLIVLAFGLIFLGYLFLGKENTWLTYLGIFLICLGFVFIYYDLHLSNLYANTIAVDSGAGTTTTGTFVMISRLLKITPYLIVLIVVGVVIKLFKHMKKNKESNDGWDNNKF